MGKSKKAWKKHDKDQKDIMHDLEIHNEKKQHEREAKNIDVNSLYVLNDTLD